MVDLPASEVERVAEVGRQLGAAAVVRAMEIVGEASTQMREALDPRVTLEVALVRITAPEADASPSALLERIDRLERRLEGGAVGPAFAPPAAGSPAAAPAAAVAPGGGAPAPAATTAPTGPDAMNAALATARAASAATGATPRAGRSASSPASTPAATSATGRRTLGSVRNAPVDAAAAHEATAPAPAASAALQPTASVAESGELPSRDELAKAWGDEILGALHPRVRSRFSAGRFLPAAGDAAVFALPGAAHRDQCLPFQGEVEAALAAHFGRRVPLRLVGEEAGVAAGADDDESMTAADLRDAPRMSPESPAERVKNAFPGAQEVDQ